MTDANRNDDEPIADVVRSTVDDTDDESRSEEGADVSVSELVDAPAAGVIEDQDDPPEPSEPG